MNIGLDLHLVGLGHLLGGPCGWKAAIFCQTTYFFTSFIFA